MPNLSVNDWLLAESFRVCEERLGRQRDETALAIARDRSADLSGRIVRRAAALETAPAVRADIERLKRALTWLGLALGIAGLVLGGLAARATIDARQVDILLAAAALLIVPSLMLLAWLVVMGMGLRGSRSGGVTGGLALAGLRWLGPRLLSSPQAADVMTAFGGAAGTPWGRWRLSAVTHGFWLGYAAGAWSTLLVFFSFVQYDLVWGTTLLADETVVAMVEWLSWWPSTLGFMGEADAAWIVAGREGAADPAARAHWARFALAMLAAWAIVPRAFLLLISITLSALRARRFTLDVSRPGYLRLSADLAPVQGTAKASGPPVPEDVRRPARRRRSNAGGIVAVAVELERGSAADLERLVPGMAIVDLGRADDRAGRGAALETVEAMTRPAAAVIGVCSMLRTPDAGTERFLVRLSEAADAPLWLLLDESGRLAQRGIDLLGRRRDWEDLARRAGGSVVLLDLDAPDAAELARLHRGLSDEEEA